MSFMHKIIKMKYKISIKKINVIMIFITFPAYYYFCIPLNTKTHDLTSVIVILLFISPIQPHVTFFLFSHLNNEMCIPIRSQHVKKKINVSYNT